MKKAVLAFIALSLSTAAFASEPLIRKSNFPGFVHPDWWRAETCEVYLDRVVITKGIGGHQDGFTVEETRTVSISESIQQVIEKASAESLTEKPNFLCDGPSTYIAANSASAGELVLFSTGGCGSPEKQREGVYTKMLRDLVDAYCPLTHRFAHDE